MMTATKLTTSQETHLSELYARMQTAKQVTDAFQSCDSEYRHIEREWCLKNYMEISRVVQERHGRDTIQHILYPAIKIGVVFRKNSLPYVVGQTAHAQDLLDYIRFNLGHGIVDSVWSHDHGIHDDVMTTFLRSIRHKKHYLHIGQERLHVASMAFMFWLFHQGTADAILRQFSDQWNTITAEHNVPTTLSSRVLALHVVQALQAVIAENEAIDDSVPTEWRVPLWEDAYREVFDNVDNLIHTVEIMQTVHTTYELGFWHRIKQRNRPWWTLTTQRNKLLKTKTSGKQ